jgi:AcrR family transcriptional regulator
MRKNSVDKETNSGVTDRNMNQASGNASVTSRPLTARGLRTRQKLLDAAETIFGGKGYESASIADITRLAEVGLGTFYLYFPDKRAIFAELVVSLSRQLRAALSNASEGVSNRLEMERVGLQAFFAFVGKHRNLYRIIRQAEFVDEELYRTYYRELAVGYVKGLQRAAQAGEIRAVVHPETLAYCLMGIGDFLGMRWVLWEGKEPPPEVLDTAIAFIRNGLAPHGEM